MKFTIEVTSVPDREGVVAEIWWGDSMVAELCRDGENEVRIEIFPARSAGSWCFDCEEWQNIIKDARKKIV